MNRTALLAPRRRFVALALSVVAALVALVALPAPAFAHAHLESTKPASGARLTVAPRELILTFSEAPVLPMSALGLFGPDSTAVALGTLSHDAGVRSISASILGPLAAGTYTVVWQTAGDDGHVQRGRYQFVIAEGARGLAPAPAPTAAAPAGTVVAPSPDSATVALTPAPRFDSSSVLYVIIRWVQFAALLVLIGAVAFRWWLLPRTGVAVDERARRELAAGAATLGLLAAWLLAESAAARLFAQAATLHGARHMADPTVISPLLTKTLWGHGWLLEILAIIVALVCLRMARREATSVTSWRVTAAAVVALAFVPAMSGHAIAERRLAPFTVLLDAAHVLAAGAWLGGLVVMLLVGVPITLRATRDGARGALTAMLNAFSPLALTSAGILVVSGIIAACLHVGTLPALWNSEYGRALLIKLAVVALLVMVATWNWRRAKPRVSSGGDTEATHLSHSARAEVLLAVLVLLVTAVLVALPTPVEMVR